METPATKTVGTLHQTPQQRFARLQRTVAQLARGRRPAQRCFEVRQPSRLQRLDSKRVPDREMTHFATDADLVSPARKLNPSGVAYAVVGS